MKGSLLYGYEGIPGLGTVPGTTLQMPMRIELFERNKVNFGLKLSPGISFYFFPGYTETGIALRLKLPPVALPSGTPSTSTAT